MFNAIPAIDAFTTQSDSDSTRDADPGFAAPLPDAGALGEFNRSSQHVQFDWPASTGPELRREFSIRGSCGAVY